ncbi:MAG: excinuclease ABC subunit UvrA [Pseudomonadota bacterium]
MSHETIRIRGATQNNLKNIDIDLPLGELIVVTGVSGSGKSSLAFDTIYAEGQRRYVETFSPYARQFLDRMDKPAADQIDGIPPAIAIDQTNPVRTSRSTVGTMTELNDHLKLLYARAASLRCPGCDTPVTRDTPESIWRESVAAADGERIGIAFAIDRPRNFTTEELTGFLAAQGYLRVTEEGDDTLVVIADRLRLGARNKTRFIESVEAALRRGHGRCRIIRFDANDTVLKFSDTLTCDACERTFSDPLPSHFSFNSPLGACETCRGFGRTMGIDINLVIPDESRTLADGAIKPWQTKSYANCQRDLAKFAKERGVAMDVPWCELPEEDREWVIAGDGKRRSRKWYGIRGFFDWLETKAYKMHVRVMLSRFRSYEICTACNGARLKPDSLAWRLGDTSDAPSIYTLQTWPIDATHAFFAKYRPNAELGDGLDELLDEIRTRLSYLSEVGLGYLTLDRQSRTLSGGEVQRINLTTALGTSLVGTLFVLDEPSIGLHPRDIERIVTIMERLRDAGNTLLVVEHDPAIIQRADRIIDIGPGPGKAGGEIIFFGTPAALRRSKTSPTAPYLDGRQRVQAERAPQAVDAATPRLTILGASENNLQDVDVSIPLNRLVVLAGVSGSGKSTLLETVLHRAMLRRFGKAKEMPGAHRGLDGADQFSDVILVDQSAIGKTTRSNPASYVGAFDAIRKRFVVEPVAKERGYTPGTFSFNSGNGRCPECNGSGFEHVEMQFLSDVYLRCPACDGRRYRAEVLEVTLHGDGAPPEGYSIADILDMTVTEAAEFFAGARDVERVLAPLIEVGLGYISLGQPVPTLSGGEAQRLKLARFLAEKPSRDDPRPKLFLFDEPTTGLHFKDIDVLLAAFNRLLEAGHSLVVIEHNLDVLRAADWIIDMGPEGGADGGRIVFEGSPTDAAAGATPTGEALHDYGGTHAPKAISKRRRRRARQRIEVSGAREHNLRDIAVGIPRNQFTVISGVSGSGKSTLAFDILFNEGQRRYLESLNAYARQFVQPAARPDVDAVTGVPPTVAIEQRTSRGGRKSTVGTMTEALHFLRLLFVRLGVWYCPDCNTRIDVQDEDQIVAQLIKRHRGKKVELLAPLVVERKGYYTDLAQWAARKGFTHLRVDGEATDTANWPRLSRYKNHDIDLPVASVSVDPRNEAELRAALTTTLGYGKGLARVASANGEQLYSTRRACPSCQRSFAEPDPRLFSFNSPLGWCDECQGAGAERLDDDTYADTACERCDGTRLNDVARAVRFSRKTLPELTALPIATLRAFVAGLALDARGQAVAAGVVDELAARLQFLETVGLGYLALDRSAPTLSGGEAQRIRLAAQLGSNLRDVCYVLDEPTIGLHARDNDRLLATLRQLTDNGNTVVVVEHDADTIKAADHNIDIGPGAGVRGGEVLASGSLPTLLRAKRSVTAKSLAEPMAHPLRGKRRAVSVRTANAPRLTISKAHRHNLKNLNAKIPLGALVGVSGVSGSGKSTLIRDIVSKNVMAALRQRGKKRPPAFGCASFDGAQHVERILEVDQTPIGKTPRSCPATYIGFWDEIRRLFAGTAEARLRGYTASRFSFNVAEGRCPECDGQGVQRLEMSFLPDVRIPCETCRGQRFAPETLSVTYRDRHIGDVLNMDVTEAREFFEAVPKVRRPLELMADLGLDYLTLGQQSPTLSGGEAQRIKLVSELAKARPVDETRASGRAVRTLYVLDEPTIGLHMADVGKLIEALHRLVDAGHSVIVIEHNLDVLAEVDWLIDLGPEGGDDGGRIVFQGKPDKLLHNLLKSHSAQYLHKMLDT